MQLDTKTHLSGGQFKQLTVHICCGSQFVCCSSSGVAAPKCCGSVCCGSGMRLPLLHDVQYFATRKYCDDYPPISTQAAASSKRLTALKSRPQRFRHSSPPVPGATTSGICFSSLICASEMPGAQQSTRQSTAVGPQVFGPQHAGRQPGTTVHLTEWRGTRISKSHTCAHVEDLCGHFDEGVPHRLCACSSK